MKTLSVRCLALVAATLCAAAVTLAPSAAHAADYDPPVVTGITVTPSVLHLPADGGTTSITITATVTDATGVASVDYMLVSERNSQYDIISATMGSGPTGNGVGLGLTAGTAQNGTWSATFDFPSGPDGKWDVFVMPYDMAGNGTPGSGQVKVGGLTVVQCPCVPTTPDAPVATAGTVNGSLNVSWPATDDDGGAPVTYTVTAFPGGTDMTTSTTSAIFTGLTPGTAYTFIVTAANSAGTSGLSPVSAPVTAPGTPPVVTPPAAAPAAPAKPTVKAGKGTLVISWKAPASHGASITGYLITYNAKTKKVPASQHALTLKHLRKGRYRVSMKAVNAVGTSAASRAVTVRVR